MYNAIDDVLTLAAMNDTFDPRRLLDTVPATAHDQALEALARDSTEVEHDGGYVWRVTATARRNVLKNVTREGARKLLAGMQPLDALGLAFRRLMQTGDTRPAANVDLGALYDAVELLRLAGASIGVDLDALSRRLRGQLNRRATDAALGIVLQNPLRGRRRELKLLLDFVANGVPALDAAAKQKPPLPGFRRIDGAYRDDVDALLVTGIGGIGKSALIAESIRRLRGKSWDGRVVVHFDFDLPSLKAGNPAAMTLELSRQIALARPALDRVMSQSRKHLRADIVDAERQTGGGYEKLQTAIAGVLSAWRDADVGTACGNLVFVLDTVEEIAVLDPRHIGGLFDWLGTVRMILDLPALHVIMVGRAIGAENNQALADRYFDAELSLADLRARPARTMLTDLLEKKAPDLTSRVPECVTRFGGNPLVLKILANYAQDRTAHDFDGLLAEAQANKGSRLDGEFAQKYLYTRMLDRVRDTEIKPLAFPGLVLRRVTPALVCDVLAGPCELGQIDSTKAEELLHRLGKQVWLVAPDGGDGVRHRRDVRRLMLPQILRGPTTQDQARDVNERAATWYEQQAAQTPRTDPRRLESLYHRALLDQPLGELEAPDLLALADHLGEDVGDLPPPILSRIRHAQGRLLSSDEVALLPDAERATAKRRRTRKLAREGLESVVIAGESVPPIRVDVSVHSPDSASPAWQWCAPDAELPDPEVFQALFVEGEFEQVAAFLPALYADLMRRIRTSEKSRVSDPLDEPIYLSAIAARAVAPTIGLAELHHLTRPKENPSEQSRSRRIDFTLFDDLALCKRMLEGGRISPSHEPILGQVRDSWAKRVAETPGQWRQLLAHALNAPGFADSARVRLSNLTFLENNLFLAMSHHFEIAAVDSATSIEPIVAAARRLTRKHKSGPWSKVVARISGPAHDIEQSRLHPVSALDLSLHGVNFFTTCADAVTVTLGLPTAQWKPATAERYLGLTPEFYGPARTALQSLQSVEPLRQAIDRIAATTAFWPRELASSTFTTSSLRSQIPILLRVADYFGAFGRLLEFTADEAPSNTAIRKTLYVFRAFESAWK